MDSDLKKAWRKYKDEASSEGLCGPNDFIVNLVSADFKAGFEAAWKIQVEYASHIFKASVDHK